MTCFRLGNCMPCYFPPHYTTWKLSVFYSLNSFFSASVSHQRSDFLQGKRSFSWYTYCGYVIHLSDTA